MKDRKEKTTIGGRGQGVKIAKGTMEDGVDRKEDEDQDGGQEREDD